MTPYQKRLKEVYAKHVEKFGVEPVVTGIRWDVNPWIILEDIDNSTEPYVEEEIPYGVDL